METRGGNSGCLPATPVSGEAALLRPPPRSHRPAHGFTASCGHPQRSPPATCAGCCLWPTSGCGFKGARPPTPCPSCPAASGRKTNAHPLSGSPPPHGCRSPDALCVPSSVRANFLRTRFCSRMPLMFGPGRETILSPPIPFQCESPRELVVPRAPTPRLAHPVTSQRALLPSSLPPASPDPRPRRAAPG